MNDSHPPKVKRNTVPKSNLSQTPFETEKPLDDSTLMPVLMRHPHLHVPVWVKQSLLQLFLKQGFKLIRSIEKK